MLKVFTRLGIWAVSIPIWAVTPRTSTIDPTTVRAFARCGEDSSADRFVPCATQSWGSANKSARLRAGINSVMLIDLYSLPGDTRSVENMASHASNLDGWE